MITPPSFKQPVLFIGHGSPMNALARNQYSKTLNLLGENLLKNPPKAILMISAHWETQGVFFTNKNPPQQIYDMYGFPDELYEVQYHPNGYPDLFNNLSLPELSPSQVLGQYEWGIDHGSWSILVHLFPDAKIPVVQLSLDRRKNFKEHYEFAKLLQPLREENILIIGSGNIVHNLRKISWKENAPIMEWSLDFDQWVNKNVTSRQDHEIVENWISHPSGKIAVPTPEHYLPLIYSLGASAQIKEKSSTPQIIYDEIQNGSISMRSYLFE
ncbi:MAG: 4,5-DOPA dioxygenase extradiol [Pseudobdellovibrio sp.]